MTWLLATFQLVHGLLHLAVWAAPRPVTGAGAETTQAFVPDHSAVLTAVHVPSRVSHVGALTLAALGTALYAAGALGLVTGAPWTAAVVIAAATVGLLLKIFFVNHWVLLGLTTGMALDVAALVIAVGAVVVGPAAAAGGATGSAPDDPDSYGRHVVACARLMGFDGVHDPGMHHGASGWTADHECRPMDPTGPMATRR